MSIVIPGPPGGGPVDPGGGPIVIPIPPGGSGSGGPEPSAFPVWPLRPQISMTIAKTFLTSAADLGDGWELRRNWNEIYTHADGMGQVNPHKGRWSFEIQFNGIDWPDVQIFWQFLIARCGNWQPFYFYNPIEAAIDPTGGSAVGRYLVRCQDALATLEAFAMKLHRGRLNLIEVRA